VAGSFESQLPIAVLWCREKGAILKLAEEHTAPSWSWAAVRGHMDFMPGRMKDTAIASIKETSVELADLRNQHGQVLSAKSFIKEQDLRSPS